MENHEIDGCTSTVSSLFLPLLCRQQPLFHPGNVCKIYSFFLCHISPHTRAHSLTHSKLHTHTLSIAISCHSSLVIILMFLLTAMVKHFEYSAACVWRRPGIFTACCYAFFSCVCIQLLGRFFGAMNRQSFVRICFIIPFTFTAFNSLSNRINFNPLPNNI